MAIYHQFIAVVIPIKIIEKKCKNLGGLKGILELNKRWVGKKILYDKYLYKDGAMGQDDIEQIIKFWIEQGLIPFKTKDGIKYWNELAVVDLVGGVTLPCDWLAYDPKDSTIYMKDKSRGKIVVPDRLRKTQPNKT